MENNVFKGKTPHKKGSSHTDLWFDTFFYFI
jgi:hypothetical protein